MQNLQGNTFVGVSFLIKLQAPACNFIKNETPTKVFSYEFCKIFKNTLFQGTTLVAAYEYTLNYKIVLVHKSSMFQRQFYKMLLLKILQNLQENQNLLSNKLHVGGLKLYLKRDPGTDIFL